MGLAGWESDRDNPRCRHPDPVQRGVPARCSSPTSRSGWDRGRRGRLRRHWLPAPGKHALVCRLYYLYGKTMSEIADDLRCSQSEITRLHRKALELLSDPYAPRRGETSGWRRRRATAKPVRPPTASRRRLIDLGHPPARPMRGAQSSIVPDGRLETQDRTSCQLFRNQSCLSWKRKEGRWVEITHRSGDLLRIRVCKIEPGSRTTSTRVRGRRPSLRDRAPERHRRVEEAKPPLVLTDG